MQRNFKFWRYVLAPFAGCLMVCAFAPYEYSSLAIVAAALLYACLHAANTKQAFLIGGLFGCGFFGFGIHWLYISIHVFGHAPPLVAGLMTVLFTLCISLYPAILCAAVIHYYPQPTRLRALCIFPAAWILMEAVRANLFGGFPWLLLGHSQTTGLFSGLMPIIGILGTSGLIVLSGNALAYGFLSGIRHHIGHALAPVLITTLLAQGLSPIAWTHPTDNTLTVSMIQGNIPQEAKWQPEQLPQTLALYKRFTEASIESDVVLWPESSIAIPSKWVQAYFDDLHTFSLEHDTALLVSAPVEVSARPGRFYNALWMLGQGEGGYQKRQLVPGEYIPFEKIISPIIAWLRLPMSAIVAGPKTQPLMKAKTVSLAPFICYDTAYAHYLAQQLPEAEMILVSTDDSWFGYSFASNQHVQMSQALAKLSGRPVLNIGNTGVTAVIGPDGTFQNRLPEYTQAVLTESVTGMQGTTPWLYWQKHKLLKTLFVLILIGCVTLPVWRVRG